MLITQIMRISLGSTSSGAVLDPAFSAVIARALGDVQWMEMETPGPTGVWGVYRHDSSHPSGDLVVGFGGYPYQSHLPRVVCTPVGSFELSLISGGLWCTMLCSHCRCLYNDCYCKCPDCSPSSRTRGKWRRPQGVPQYPGPPGWAQPDVPLSAPPQRADQRPPKRRGHSRPQIPSRIEAGPPRPSVTPRRQASRSDREVSPRRRSAKGRSRSPSPPPTFSPIPVRRHPREDSDSSVGDRRRDQGRGSPERGTSSPFPPRMETLPRESGQQGPKELEEGEAQSGVDLNALLSPARSDDGPDQDFRLDPSGESGDL
jgi:hypothetical protein